MTEVAAVNERAKLRIIPVFLKVFIIPDPTPNFAGGVEDIMALVLEGQKKARPIPDNVSMAPISTRGVLMVSLLNKNSAIAASTRPITEIALNPYLSERIPPIRTDDRGSCCVGDNKIRGCESRKPTDALEIEDQKKVYTENR